MIVVESRYTGSSSTKNLYN